MVADHGQIFVFGATFDDGDALDTAEEVADPYTAALHDAIDSGRFVGTCGALTTIVTPGQFNSASPMLVEVWASRPPDDSAAWDHEVEVDLDAAEGRLTFEYVGGVGDSVHIPAARYRARVSGRGFGALGTAGANGRDNYRLRLFPRRRSASPRLRKSWPGRDAYH
ncbi:hypothetical protein UG55_1006201 [Frankia sp. EI5c]|uniref:hypothetical protein n=1 Tax=Frankia sp. EI5c TaxID=683316 RepID=UPI0007C30F2B|nr:hypothetical protein [Frankia sp. EI5c]OAA28228.1 hypothetical protein UG55_1006201 [Frankia sp. EI5c]